MSAHDGALRSALRRQSKCSRWFWCNGTISVPPSSITDLRPIAYALSAAVKWADTWTSPIALMVVPHTATHIYKFDAS
jgi:hypothetical protein